MSDHAQLIRSSRLAAQVEYAYAAVAHPDAQLIFTAGACPLDEHGNIVPLNDVAGQARKVMQNLRVALVDAGAAPMDVVKTTVYVASSDRADLAAAWEVVRDAFSPHDPPSTLVGVTVLGYHGQLVEVEAVAVTSADPITT